MSCTSRARRLRAGALTALAAACASTTLAADHTAPESPDRVQTLGIVRVDGAAPSSLPSRIPTTMEGVTGEAIARDINATDAEDALKYLPSLLVRKRYIGDYNHAVLSTRASGTGNSARSLVYADGILLSNLLGNGASFAPRWGLVSPEEIARVDVMYGPFSAAYPGNAVGAVVDFQTRMPTRFEAHARLGYSHQPSGLLGARADARQASASIGSADGAFSWWLHAGRTDSEGPPQTFATRSLSATAPADGAVPVSGAVSGVNRANQPWLLLASGTQYDTVQDQAKLKLAYDLDPGLRLLYVFGFWSNGSDGQSRSFLRDAGGRAVDHRYGGGLTQPISIDGKGYLLSASDFPQTRDELEHRMHAVSLKRRVRDGLGWELSGSVYDYLADRSRAYAPTGTAANGGRLTDQAGTGWNTLSARLTWTPAGSAHTIDAGLSQEQYQLRSRVYATSDWRDGAAGALSSRFDGDTRVRAVFAQDAWTFAPDWTAVLGLRGERWSAFDGVTQSTSTSTSTSSSTLATQQHPARSQTAWSPKAAISYGISNQWVLKASTGRAVRFPTVSELFQGGFNPAGQFINNDPRLKPERSWTSELSAEWTGADRDALRVTLFHEDSRDALYSQLNTATNANTVQNIDRIRTRGVELSGTAGLPRHVTLTGSVTFADSVILANAGYATTPGDTIGKWQPRVPRWRATMLAQWQAREDLSVSLGARYSGKQFSTLDNSDVNGFAYMAASKYFTVDTRVQWKVDRQWTLSAGIDNLNNYQYWNFHPYPGRTFQVEARWDY